METTLVCYTCHKPLGTEDEPGIPYPIYQQSVRDFPAQVFVGMGGLCKADWIQAQRRKALAEKRRLAGLAVADETPECLVRGACAACGLDRNIDPANGGICYLCHEAQVAAATGDAPFTDTAQAAKDWAARHPESVKAAQC